MENDICRKLLGLLTIPSKYSNDYDSWLEQTDFIDFLEENANEDKIIIYASSSCYSSAPSSSLFVYSILVPKGAVSPPDVDDLLTWNFLIRDSAWGIYEAGQKVWLEPSLSSLSSKSLAQGEHLVFNRSLEGVEELSYYMEIQQKFSHVCGIHHMPERKAWCRLNRHGEIEHVVQEVDVALSGKDRNKGKIVLFNRDVLEMYAGLTETVLVRMFDFDRFCTLKAANWKEQEEKSNRSEDIFYRYGLDPGNRSYTRGIQIVPIAISKKEAAKRIYGDFNEGERQQEKFIVARDFENKKIEKISYEDGMHFETAFFRPEVLSKYKADLEKYNFEENHIGCRGSWHLEFYDINEAGQVYAFLKHLSYLPNEEQLNWKQFNEKPKAQIPRHVIKGVLYGESSSYYSPLAKLKDKLRSLQCKWWRIPTPDVIKRAQHPATGSNDDWRDEIIHLDQLLVEGFKKTWLGKKAKELGRTPEKNMGSLKLLEECLIGLDFEEDHAHSIVAPLQELHYLRSNLGTHALGETAQRLKAEAFAKHGSYRNHYKNVVTRCDETMQILVEAF